VTYFANGGGASVTSTNASKGTAKGKSDTFVSRS
jgi:hypothetical protein